MSTTATTSGVYDSPSSAVPDDASLSFMGAPRRLEASAVSVETLEDFDVRLTRS